MAGSLAIDAGSNALAVDASGNALTTDQRGLGFSRFVGTVDIGAFEAGNATGYLVNLTSDTGAGSDGAGDLLYCITQANANTNPLGSLIEFDPTVFSTAKPQTIKLSSTLELTETAGPEMIDGPGASVVTISGNNAVGVFDVAEGVTATLSGVTISGGMNNQAGGAIYNDGTLTVTDSTFTNNTSGADGGAIADPGTLTLTNCTIENNSAPFGGGIDNEGTLTVIGSIIESNTANNVRRLRRRHRQRRRRHGDAHQYHRRNEFGRSSTAVASSTRAAARSHSRTAPSRPTRRAQAAALKATRAS